MPVEKSVHPKVLEAFAARHLQPVLRGVDEIPKSLVTKMVESGGIESQRLVDIFTRHTDSATWTLVDPRWANYHIVGVVVPEDIVAETVLMHMGICTLGGVDVTSETHLYVKRGLGIWDLDIGVGRMSSSDTNKTTSRISSRLNLTEGNPHLEGVSLIDENYVRELVKYATEAMLPPSA